VNSYQQMFNLSERVAVVTGAAGILGAELCVALGELGARVACLDCHEDHLSTLEKKLSNHCNANQFLILPCDISNADSVDITIKHVLKHFSCIDILFNNAATKSKNPRDFFINFSDYPIDLWREIMAVNLDGMFLMAQAVGKHMLSKKQGSIIQTASMYGLIGPDQRIYEGSHYLEGEINTPAVYTASKAGVIGLTKHLATLWGSYNIRVNAICPGGVSSGQNSLFQEKYSARVPMGRMAEKKDIVGPMLFLASDASQYVTGQVLYADGGLSSW